MGHNLPGSSNSRIEDEFIHPNGEVQLFENGPTYCCDFFHNVTLMLEDYELDTVAASSDELSRITRGHGRFIKKQESKLYGAVSAFMKSQMTAFEIANFWTYGPVRVLSAQRQLENFQSKFSPCPI